MRRAGRLRVVTTDWRLEMCAPVAQRPRRRSLRVSSSLSCLVLTASVLLQGAAFAESEPAPFHLTSEEVPSLRDLQQLRYEPSSSASMPTGIPSYSALLNIARSFAKYRRGLELLANYQEPTGTRGPDGIAVFRKTAGAVVAVVAADGGDDQITYRGFGTGSSLIQADWWSRTGMSFRASGGRSFSLNPRVVLLRTKSQGTHDLPAFFGPAITGEERQLTRSLT